MGALGSPWSRHSDCGNSCSWGDHSTPHPPPGMLHQLCFSIHSSAESGLNEYCQGQHRKRRLPLLSLSSRHFGAREIAYRTLVDKTHGSRIGPGWNRSSRLWISVPSASAHLSGGCGQFYRRSGPLSVV